MDFWPYWPAGKKRRAGGGIAMVRAVASLSGRTGRCTGRGRLDAGYRLGGQKRERRICREGKCVGRKNGRSGQRVSTGKRPWGRRPGAATARARL